MTAINFSIRGMDKKIWMDFRRACMDEIDDKTGREISANEKVKRLIEGHVKSKS